MKQELDLSGKVALVTGGGTGLGLGIAKELKDLGATVVIAGRRLEVLQATAEKWGLCFQQMDLADHASLPAAVDEVCKRFGGIDILVNNAGVQDNRPALEFDEEAMDRLFSINVHGTYFLTRAVAQKMLDAGRGSIVFITSSAVHMALTKNLGYSASKGALSSMMRAFASELSPMGIRVNAVVPGWIETELVKESLRRIPERRAMVERRSLMGRLGTPQDVGMAVAFLASDAARFLTAVELRVDGGISVSL